MNNRQLQDTLVEIVELLNADPSIEHALTRVGQIMNGYIPNDRLGFHFLTLGLSYRMKSTGFEKFDTSHRWDEKNEKLSALRWVLMHGKSLKRDQIEREKRFERDHSRIKEGMQSQLVVPLIVGQETIGAMNFVSKTPNLYTDIHVEQASLFARLIATKIHQMYLYQEMQGIGNISQAIQSSSDLDHILISVLEHIQSLGYDRVRVYLYDEERQVLMGAAQVGSEAEGDFKEITLPVSEDRYSQQTFQCSGACIYVTAPEDLVVYAHVKNALGEVPPHTWADLPLYIVNEGEKRIVGKISLDNIVSQQPLVQARLDRLVIYAAQAANAIWKAQLYKNIKDEVAQQTKTLHDQVKQREALLEINRAVLKMKRPDELGDVARVFLRSVQQMDVNAQAVAIHRVVDESQNLVETFRVLHTGHVTVTGKRKSTTSIQIWREGGASYDPDLTVMSDEERIFFREKFEDLSILSMVDVPFSLGVISVHSIDKDAFTEHDVDRLKQIAETMSVGIKRLEDLEALERQYDILQENEARYRNLIRLMDGVVYALDWKSKKYTYMDESVYDLTGYKPKELDHAFCQSLIGDEIELTRYETIPPEMQLSSDNTPTVFRSKYCLNTKDGKKIWVMDCALEFRNDAGELIHTLGILLNLTDQMIMEEGLRQSQKMEAIGQLAGGVAHDFNNLLTGILGLSDLLLLRLPEYDPNRKDIEAIQKAGIRAADLTTQLLAFSRKQMIEPQILDVNDVMSDMQTMLRRLIREDIELVVSMASITKPIEMDRGQLEQIILNLVVNAKDAMPQGGELTLRTNQMVLDVNQVRFMGEINPGAYVIFEVKDTGIGMDTETKEHIFEPFFTTKEKGQGTGLGLATVYGIVAQNGGHIAVESTPNRGSVFCIYLPQVDKPFEEECADDSRDLLVGCETILLAEDEESVRELVARTLSNLGYQVLAASNGQEALRAWHAHDHRIDLLLTDVVMPGMGGNELAETLRIDHPHLPILYMSGYAEERTGGEGLRQQASAFIKKPFMPEELVKEIRSLLDE